VAGQASETMNVGAASRTPPAIAFSNAVSVSTASVLPLLNQGMGALNQHGIRTNLRRIEPLVLIRLGWH
jgi:hypothetical protein